MEYNIFISYSRNDFEQVKVIKEVVELTTGAFCWMDLDGIESGERFKKVIISAINRCETILFMLSEHSMKSEWALDELDFAKMKGKRLVIVHLEEVKMTDEFYFSYHKYDQITWSVQQQREKLLKDITRWVGKEKGAAQEAIALDAKYLRQLEEIDDPEKLNDIGFGLCRYNVRKYDIAFKFFMKAAEMGHADAQYNLGAFFEHGRGVLKDSDKAIEYYSKAAEQGHVIAQCQLAQCYDNTEYDFYDQGLAFQWYLKAAEQGNRVAQEKVGKCYLDGKVVGKDERQAVKWLTMAANQGSDTAQFLLGRCYEKGTGVEADLKAAVDWYKKAAVQGNITAQHLLNKW